MAKTPSGGTPATVALTRAGVPFTLHPYVHEEAAAHYGEEAAAALGLEPTRIFKTLLADLGGELVVAVVPVARQLDLKALAAALGAKKAAMADTAAATPAPGTSWAASPRWVSAPGCGPSSTARPPGSPPSTSPPAGGGCRWSWLPTT